MANTLTALLPKILSRGLISLREKAIMTRLVNTDYSSDAANQGDTINVPIPTAMTATAVTPAATLPAIGGITPATTPIVLDQWYESRFHLTDKEMTEIDKNQSFLPMQIEESLRAIVNTINADVHSKYKKVGGYVGTAGTTPFGSGVLTQSATNLRKTLNKQLCPLDLRRAVLNYDAEAAALELAAFQDADKAGGAGVKIEGQIGRKFGIDWYTDDQVPTHTAGTITTGLIAKASTAVAVGATSFVATTAASTGACALLAGDVIAIGSETYSLAANATQASASTDVTLTLNNPIRTALVGSEAITVKATHVVNMAFHRNAYALAMRSLAKSNVNPEYQSVMTDPQTGLSLRLEVLRGHKVDIWAFDALWGSALVRPELACRLAG